MKALERITKDSSQGRDQTCPVLPGETTTGQSSGSLLPFEPNNFSKRKMWKADVSHNATPLKEKKKLYRSVCLLKTDDGALALQHKHVWKLCDNLK